MALADAELRASEVPALIQELARSPALVRALQVYVSLGRSRIGRPYAAKRDEPVPQWLVDTVMTAPMAEPARRQPLKFQDVVGALLGWLKYKYRAPGWSLAAGPAMAAALAGAFAWALLPVPSQGEAALAAAKLQRALETTGSGKEDRLLAFRPIMTFVSKDQTYCRQYEVRTDAERTAAVACRDPNGVWQVLKQTPPFPVGPMPAGSSKEELDRFTLSLMRGEPLGEDHVEKLSTTGWRDRPAAAPLSETPKQ
jgi:hypothetical protein